MIDKFFIKSTFKFFLDMICLAINCDIVKTIQTNSLKLKCVHISLNLIFKEINLVQNGHDHPPSQA